MYAICQLGITLFTHMLILFSGESGFKQWSAWSQCSKTCGKGLQKRTRECKYSNVNTHENCSEGLSSQEISCYEAVCPGKKTS